MTPSRRGWWAIFAACAIVVLAAMAWISRLVLDLETREDSARGEVARLQETRLALWRMDSWLAPQLAREAARPWFEYEAYYFDRQAYDAELQPLNPDAVRKRSPLLTFASPWFRIHFQLRGDNTLSSPQAPEGNFQDLAEATVLSGDTIDANRVLMGQNRPLLVREELLLRIKALEARLPGLLSEADAPLLKPGPTDVQTADYNNNDRAGFVKRAKNTYASKNPQQWQEVADGEKQQAEVDAVDQALPVQVGSLLPLWIGEGARRELAFVRRVTVGDEVRLQGFLADWPALETSLLELTADLLPGATLEPVPESALADDVTGRVLATVPVALVPPPATVSAPDPLSPARAAVLVTWIAVLTSLLAGALTLRTVIETAEKRRRFTSAVTHELRTPLTTFRMYTEMLAEGMIDEAKKQEYLRTLQDESARLGSLVENVLTYARLEEGRAPARRQPVPFGELLDRLRPALERRVTDADGVLRVDVHGDLGAVLQVDADAVSQILFNLVDNACKYGRDGGAANVTLAAEANANRLRFRVTDRGPGVPTKHRGGVFKPFDRGDRGAGDAVQGVGLGLALARGLARELGGDLRLEDASPGATFVLDLPAA